MTDASATRGARSDPQGLGDRGEEAKSRKSLKNLFRLWRRRGGETDLRDAIEELIEESEDAEPGEAALDTSESDLLLNVLKFGEMTAYDVMAAAPSPARIRPRSTARPPMPRAIWRRTWSPPVFRRAARSSSPTRSAFPNRCRSTSIRTAPASLAMTSSRTRLAVSENSAA